MKCQLCAGNSIRFRHMNGCPCEIFKVFWTENDSTWGGLEPPTFEIMPNALTIWDIRPRHLLSHVFEYWQYTLTIYAIHNIDDKSCHRDEVFNQQQYQVICRPHEFNGGVIIYPCPNLSTIYTTVQSKLEKYPFWILIDEIMFLYMTRPVPLGFFINKFPLWDGAGLWPIKVSQACPTG